MICHYHHRISGVLHAITQRFFNPCRMTCIFIILCMICAPESVRAQPESTSSERGADATNQPNATAKKQVDQFGDPLPDLAVARLGTLRMTQGNGMRHIVLSPDKRQVIAFENGAGINFWRIADGKRVRTLRVPSLSLARYGYIRLAISDNGQWLAVQDGDEMHLINLKKGASQWRTRFEDKRSWHRVRYRDDRADEETRIASNRSYMNRAVFSPNAGRLVVAANPTTVFDVKTGTELATLPHRSNIVVHALFHGGPGQVITVSYDGTVRIWDVSTEKIVQTFNAFGPIDQNEQAKNEDDDGIGRMTVKGPDVNTLTINTEMVRDPEQDGDPEKQGITSADITSDGRLMVLGGIRGHLSLWNMKHVNQPQRIATLDGAEKPIIHLTFSPDEESLVTREINGVLRIWDIAQEKVIGRVKDAPVYVENKRTGPSFGLDGRLLGLGAYAGSGGLHVWKFPGLESLQWPGSRVGPSAEIRQVRLMDGGATAVTGNDWRLRFWDARTGKLKHTYRADDNATILDVTSNRKELFVAEGGYDEADLMFIDSATFQITQRIEDVGTVYASQVALSSDGQRIAAGVNHVDPDNENYLRVVDRSTGKMLMQRRHPKQRDFRSVAWSPDGKRIAATEDGDRYPGIIRIYQADSGDVRVIIQLTDKRDHRGNKPIIHDLRFTDDGKHVVARVEGKRRYWNARTGARVEIPDQNANRYPADATVAPNGEYAATVREHLLYLWTPNGHRKRVFSQPSGAHIHDVAFSADSSYLVSGSADGTALVWDVDAVINETEE